jgi:hypothetical protein
MPSKPVILTGSLPNIKPEDATRLAVYLVRGKTILASSSLQEKGSFRLAASRDAIAAEGNQALEAVVGPAGLTGTLPDSPVLQRSRLNRAEIARSEKEISISKNIALNESALVQLLRWCRRYCVSGTVVGQDGCAVPGATVTVYSVGFTGYGYSKVPRATVTADQYGNFTACFTWCTSLFPCWPCWPIWWFCWPWWWEWDLLHIIEILERSPIGPVGPGPVENISQGLALIRPSGKELIRGQGFATARSIDFQFGPDEKRTALIQRKLANPKLRAIFPWWWWCCDDPNIVFSVNQGANSILDENPATDTRWCLEDDSFVTLVVNDSAVTVCPPDPQPESGFAWTRVGNITVDHIHQGYADGFAGTDSSDLAFAGTLDIYGQFAPGTPVSYYQVEAGQWSGNPARGGTAPASSSPLGVDLYNYLFIYDASFSLVFAGQIKMGPFTQGGLTDLYATEQSRRGAPTGTGLDPLPPLPAGGFELWAYQGLKVSTGAGNLVMGSLGAVDLTLSGYDNAFNPAALAPDAPLTLTIDNQGLTTMHINGITAYKSDGSLAPLESSATTDCPAYVIGPGGYVTIDVTAKDNNGHIFEYQVDAEWGHGHSATVTPPSTRGYVVNTSPFPISVSAPNLAQKSFVGGNEVMTYYPTTNCCYEFRIRAGKRVTQGYTYPGLGDFDFQTISLKIS